MRSPPAGNGGAGGSGAPTGAGGDTGGAGGGTGGAGGAAAGGSGGGNPDGSVPALTHQTTGQSWTFLVYMAADNNLETAALLDLQEMAEVGSTSQTHIVVQIDRSAGYVQSPVVDLPDFSGAKRLLVHNSSLEVLQNLGSVDSGSGDTLAQFITWGISHYPADRTALILWDHGGGWNGYGVDETAGSLITAPALRTAIAQGLAGAQLPRLALVGFDACLMATFEIASMLKPYAEYLLASEEIIPGHGLDYVALSAATVDPTIAPPALARRLMDGYVAQSMTYGDDATITMSLTDLYALGDLQAALGDLAGASGTPLSTVKATTIGRTRGVAREFGDQGQTPGVMVDVVDLAADLGAADPAYATASTEIAAAVRKAVLLEHHGPSRAGSNGLSVYFPFQLRDEDPAFEQIMDVAAWRGFLDAYLGVANGGPVGAPAFSNPGGVADAQIVGGQLVVSGTLTPGSSASISSATLYYGIYDTTSGSLFVLGSTPADYDSTTVQGSWDLGILRLDQGTASAYGYLSAEVAQDGSVSLTIPFVYDQSAGATDQNAFRVLVFDAALTLVQDGYYLDSSGVFGPLTAAVGSTLSATILVTDQSGLTQWIKTNVAFDAMQPIAPSIESLPTGTVVFGELVIQNIREESSFVVATLSI